MLFKKSLKYFTSIFLSLVISVLVAGYLYAEVPKFINYQGKLTNKSGTSLNGIYTMIFTIYNAETGGTSQWTETQSSVAVNNGIFNVILGGGPDGNPETTGDNVQIPASVFYGSQRWLGVKVNSDSEMSPRNRFTSVGYAITADNLQGMVFVDGNRVGINTTNWTTNPTATLHIGGSTRLVGDLYVDGGQDNTWELRMLGGGVGDEIIKFTSNAGGGMLWNMTTGKIGIGTQNPQYRLDVEGSVQAQAYYTGDIIFQKDKEKL